MYINILATIENGVPALAGYINITNSIIIRDTTIATKIELPKILFNNGLPTAQFDAPFKLLKKSIGIYTILIRLKIYSFLTRLARIGFLTVFCSELST